MANVLVQESSLQAIAASIRQKNGSSTTYQPGQMAAAIQALPGAPTLQNKTATQNGTVTPDTGYDGLSQVTVNVPNSYSQSDEGKVVSNGALVAQTARSGAITQNGTYDTTNNNEVTVNVSGGGGGSTILSGASEPTAAQGNNGDIYLEYWQSTDTLPAGYTPLKYIESTGSERIETGIPFTPDTIFRADFTFLRNNNTGSRGYGILMGTGSTPWYYLCPSHWGGSFSCCAAVGRGENISYKQVSTGQRYQWEMTGSSVTWKQDGTVVNSFSFSACTAQSAGNMALFNHSGSTGADTAIIGRLYRCTIYDGNTMVRDFVPALNLSNEAGLYDLVGQQFYGNVGSGAFIGMVSLEEITAAFLKVNDTWQNLIGSDINDVGGITV